MARRPCGWPTRQPEVALLDIAMPHLNGLETARAAAGGCAPDQEHYPDDAHGRALCLRGPKAGAVGYVVKTQAAADLVQAIHTVVQGGSM